MIDFRAVFEMVLFFLLGIPGLILLGIAILLMSFMLWMGTAFAFTELAKRIIGFLQSKMGRMHV